MNIKPVKVIWIVVVLLSLAAGLWQLKNIQFVRREYSSFYKHIKYKGYASMIYGPFISPRAAKEDPEAAAVAEIQLSRLDRERDEEIEAVAEKLLAYPGNNFFLFELVRNLLQGTLTVDPQIALRFAGRLIALEPDNANYHYLNCSVLLADRDENNIDAAIEELEYANKCADYDFPYTSYRQRAIDIAQEAKIACFLMPELYSSYSSNPATSDIRAQLTGEAKAEFTDGYIAKGMRITDALARMQMRQIRDVDLNAISSTGLNFQSGAYRFGYWHQPQGLELQRVNLTKERAKEDRLQLCALMRTSVKASEENKIRGKEMLEKRKEKLIALLAVPPGIHADEMFVALLCVCTILLFICLARGFGEKTGIGLGGIGLFIGSCAYYFCIIKGFFLTMLLEKGTGHSGGLSYADILRPSLWLTHFKAEPMFFSLFLAGPIVIALVLWVSGLIRPIKGAFWRFWYLRVAVALVIGILAASMAIATTPGAVSYPREELWRKFMIVCAFASVVGWAGVTFVWWLFGWRIVRLFLATTFWGFLTLLAGGYRYVHYLPMIAFVFTAAVITVVKPDEGSAFKTVLRFFSKKPEVAAIRNKCLRLTAPFIVVYWLIFVILAPWVVKSINLDFVERKTIVERKVILPDPNEAYQELIGILSTNNPGKGAIARLIGLVMPEDLPALLRKLKNTEFQDYHDYSRWLSSSHASEQEKARLEKQRGKAQSLNNNDLADAMLRSGRDTVGIITSFMDDPNDDRALVSRAKLGDSTAKEKLEQLLQNRLQSELENKQNKQRERSKADVPRPVKTAEIICGLACISEPNEAAQRFLNYIQKRDVPDLIDDNEFFNGLSLLPTIQARTIIKAYLDKVLSWQPSSKRRIHYMPLSPLRYLVGPYGDSYIAQEVFTAQLLSAETERHFDPYEISSYFTMESAPLLKKGLDSKNSDMRAWCVWQLRKIGYKFDNTELEKLMRDESWKVRANAAFAGGKEVATIAAKDKNAFVRLVVGF